MCRTGDGEVTFDAVQEKCPLPFLVPFLACRGGARGCGVEAEQDGQKVLGEANQLGATLI